ncbi:MAG: serine hydrolase domain-containing protein [Bradymonadaceae bacterium]
MNDSPRFSPKNLDALLLAELASSPEEVGTTATASAIQAVVADTDGIVFEAALGHRNLLTESRNDVTSSTPVDVASLTKPLVGATLFMQAIDEGRIEWDTPVGRFLPSGDENLEPVRRATFLQLLNHSSGLPAWRQFYLEGFPFYPDQAQADRTRKTILDTIRKTPLNAPPGTAHEYSDLGYILLAHLLERVFDAPLHELANLRIFAPLGMDDTRYVCLASGDEPIHGAVATEFCAHRERVVVGTVHDENTHIVGGVSAHAGVFSTARDLHRFTHHLLTVDAGSTGIVKPETLRFCWSSKAASTSGSHVGGWDRPSGPKSSAGRGFGRDSSVGHLGFSGTSIWIDRAPSITAILLTNRVHPSRENERIKKLRIDFHEAILTP